MISKEELVEQLNKGFECLSDRERLVLTLVYFEELTIDEIAYILEISTFDVDTYLIQAKTIMRNFTSIFDDIDNKGKEAVEKFNKGG